MTKFVLIPGAWLGGWIWKKIIPLMQREGHEVYPITLTGMGERVHLVAGVLGIETAIQDVVNVIEFNDLHDLVLVGHSFAGKVAAAVGDRVSNRVSSILYLDAFRPERNRSPQGSFDPASEFGPPPQGSSALPFKEEILDSIGKDIVGSDRSWMLSKSTPWPMKYATDSITLSEKFDSLRSEYVFCTQTGDPIEEVISGKWGELYGPYRLIESGHWPMVSKPDEVVESLIELSGR